MKKTKFYGYLYFGFWIIPLTFFIKDFFHISEIQNINFGDSFELFKISLIQGLLSVVLSTIIAIIPSYYISYEKNILTKLLESLIFIPFFFPAVSTVIGFTLLFKLPILKNFELMYSLKAIILANIFYNSPIMVRYISQGLKGIPKNIIEAGRIDGANELNIFFKIKLPLFLPQLFKGMFLVFIYTFSSFGIVLTLGGLRYSNLEVEIANSLLRDGDFTRALILGIFQFIFLIFISYIGDFLPLYESIEQINRKKISVKIIIFSLFYLLFEYSIVLIGVLYGFYNYYTNKFSFDSLFKIFSKNFNFEYPVIEGIINSLFLATITPLFVIIFTYLLLKNFNKTSNRFIVSTMGFSSAFLGVILIYINILFEIKLWILLIIGYFLITVPIAYSFMFQYIIEFPEDIVSLSKLDIKSSFKRFFLIEFPILKNIFIGTYLQIFAIILGEFTISYTMQLGSEFPTIALVNYALYSNKKFLEGAILSSISIIIISTLFYLSSYINKNET